MVPKSIFFTLTAVILVQIAYGQSLGSPNCYSSAQNNIGIGNARGINFGSNGINFGSNGINLGSNGINFGSNGINYGSNGISPGLAGIGSAGAFEVVSGSPVYDYPVGIQVATEDIEIGGQVAVNGAMPFLGSVAVDGNLPIGGQAALSYAAGPGVNLNGGGCKGSDVGITANINGNILGGGNPAFGFGVGNNLLSRPNFPCNKI